MTSKEQRAICEQIFERYKKLGVDSIEAILIAMDEKVKELWDKNMELKQAVKELEEKNRRLVQRENDVIRRKIECCKQQDVQRLPAIIPADDRHMLTIATKQRLSNVELYFRED